MAGVTFPWLTGWQDEAPIELGYTYVPRDQWTTADGIRTHLEFFDSRLTETTGGLIGAQYVRFVGHDDGDHGWHVHDLDWQCFYVLQGTMQHQTEQEGQVTLGAGDSGYYPGFLWHREWGFSDDCEMIALRVPARTTTYTGRETELPEREATVDPGRGPVYAYERDPWTPAGDFEFRDTGSTGGTEGRLGMRVVRAAREGAAHDWHYSTAAKWLVVVGGSAVVEVRGRDPLEVGFLDAFSLPAGPAGTRRVHSASGDYRVLELSIPAAAETISD